MIRNSVRKSVQVKFVSFIFNYLLLILTITFVLTTTSTWLKSLLRFSYQQPVPEIHSVGGFNHYARKLKRIMRLDKNFSITFIVITESRWKSALPLRFFDVDWPVSIVLLSQCRIISYFDRSMANVYRKAYRNDDFTKMK